MLQLSSTLQSHSADVARPVSAAAWMTATAGVLPVEFYYGYWFSHWRA
ncbi:MAG: hypothetical protein K0R45_1535 [Pseudomonas sp.]|nr:hypothetical protein [Pseudomonas sp.]